MLLDEPFSALDIQTRQLMENELLQLWEQDKKSVIFITHDLEEAISLSDRVIVLDYGEKIAEGSYREVVRNERVIEAYLGRKHGNTKSAAARA